MLKIQAFYRSKEDLEKADEVYKSVTFIINKLRLKEPKGKNSLSQNFKDTKAVSCIRYIAEELTKSQVTFVSSMKNLWVALLHPQKKFSDTFDNYAVPYEYYQGIIFGGVYYVLSKQKTVDDERLEMMVSFVSNYPEALDYFNVFKTELSPLTSQSSTNNATKNTDIKTLRNNFIQSLNTSFVQIDAIDWADATMGFNRTVMTELFWSIEDDKLLKAIIKEIINTWNALAKVKDNRCLEVIQSKALPFNDPWKFGGLNTETINKFFDDLWVERNARKIYSSAEIVTKNTTEKKSPQSSSSQQQNFNSVDQELMESLKKRVEELEKRDKENTEIIDSLKSDLAAEKLKRQSSDKKCKEPQQELNKTNENLASILAENDEETILFIDKKEYKFTNKIRYELFLRLLENSGCEPSIHASQIMISELWEAMTEKSGEKCRQYITNRKYQTTITMKSIPSINVLLKSMGINVQL